MKTTFIPRTLPIRVACAFLFITAITLPPRSRNDITAPMPEPTIALSSDSDRVTETSEDAPIIYRTYTINNVGGAKPLAQIKSEAGEENLAAVLKLNRVDDAHLRNGETILIPEQVTDLIDLSPFPREAEQAREIPRLLVVSRRVQAFGAYEFGRLVRWGPTSTGKKHTPTPAGLYHANWRSKATRSTVNRAWLLRWYVNIDNEKGIAVHEYELPGYPASHSCVRMQADDAAWFYYWAKEGKLSADGKSDETGTPVLVFGEYSYGEKPPWKQLMTDSRATTVTKVELEEALLPYAGKF
ncbi:MAG: L,D-transpeptidase [Blastocatellia bacterium]|nr:L,D-transpeptidase [Blastocatellia bacterium]